jgi:hypothetical protein
LSSAEVDGVGAAAAAAVLPNISDGLLACCVRLDWLSCVAV